MVALATKGSRCSNSICHAVRAAENRRVVAGWRTLESQPSQSVIYVGGDGALAVCLRKYSSAIAVVEERVCGCVQVRDIVM